jgi:predicted DNA-binding ribbon-helix-helix protein
MSTKWKKQIDEAQKELSKNPKRRHKKPRITQQIRIEKLMHRGLRLLAREEHTTISKLISKIALPHVAGCLKKDRKEKSRSRVGGMSTLPNNAIQ